MNRVHVLEIIGEMRANVAAFVATGLVGAGLFRKSSQNILKISRRFSHSFAYRLRT